jgi:uncharacterized membrane protein YeaQ/YmgE (transglycosylase-associated protein family)
MTEGIEKTGDETWPLHLILGALAGLLVWLVDHDFFINPGGPSPTISNFICDSLGLDCLSNMKTPLLILAVVGAIVGTIIGKIRDWDRETDKKAGKF